MIEKDEGGLSAAEEAYFETAGEEAPPETEAEAAPAESDAAASDGDAQAALDGAAPRDEKGKFIPHAVFHAEREEHKRTKSELQELKQFRAAMEEKMRWTEALLNPQQQQEVDPDPRPDPAVDVFAHSAWVERQLAKLAQEREQERQQIEYQQQVQQLDAQVWNHWHQSAAQFKAEKPDFEDAAKWLAEYRDKQLSALSSVDPRFGDKRARDAQMNEELKGIIVSAAQAGKSPAEAIYEIASGYGYSQAGAQQASLTLSDKLKGIASAQEASRTVAQASGRTAGGEITLETIAAMPEKEFMEWAKNPANEKILHRLMEG